jgi:hypothetical protein
MIIKLTYPPLVFVSLIIPLVLTADVVVNLGSYDDVDGEGNAAYAPYVTGSGFRTTTVPDTTFDVSNPGTAVIGLGATFGTGYTPLTIGTNLSVPTGYSGAGLKFASTIVDATGNAVFTSTPLGYHRITDNTSTSFQHALGLNAATVDSDGEITIPSERSTDTSFASAFFYEKADFLAGANNSIVSFAAGDEIAASYSLGYASGHGRMIIKDSGNWYVSDTVTNGAQTLNSNSNFYAYDLESDLIIGGATLGSAVSASSFTDIEAVGIHMEQLNFDSTSAAETPYIKPFDARHFFEGFSADLTLTPVPEFSFSALLLSLSVLTFACIRRKSFGLGDLMK